MVQLLILRHGKTSWNLQKRIQGRRDIRLCPEGIEELKKRRIPPQFTAYRWITSPLQRAQETAAALQAPVFTTDPALLEMDWGEWEGHSLPELRAQLGPEMSRIEARGRHMTPTGGESPADVMARLTPWIAGLETDTIAVTHKGVIRALLAIASGWEMKDPYPEKIDWSAAHLFSVNDAKQIKAVQLNISLEIS